MSPTAPSSAVSVAGRPDTLPAGLTLTRRQLLVTSLAIPGAGGGTAARAQPPLPSARAVPGGVALIELGAATQRPQVRFKDAPVLVLGDPTAWTAILGIPLAAKPGVIDVAIEGGERHQRSRRVTIEAATYAVQSLRVPQRQVELSKADLARHERERTHLAKVTATHSERVPASLRMQAPVPGPRSSSFGLRRVFNGQARSPHSGMDIAAPTGTPILAPLAGLVIDVGDYFFAGRCIWLDHGSGVLTLYAHLDRIGVAVGREIEAGEPLGTVGATGRVTGPHLHWSVMLNRAYVDPALFLPA
jgi:murein DD-endopeptidase MepM/ murein hydrolase activator NlpD